ncbi:unnamed protein product [Paramecium primaurelia]|uniref:Protein kinase domain-containing protein n=1 Tax=Paramecium primaurelia TaxID=5886 RepID=A0A8S1N6W2_PARPR|nr:unnamed protein product [Paramecium primaurelia]
MKEKFSGVQEIQEVFQNRYTNPQLVGLGAFSQVYKCENNNKEFVAIKIVALNRIEKEVIPYMINEIVLLQSSQNNNVIQLIEAFQTPNRLYIVLEYCFIDLEKMIQKYYRRCLPDDLVIIILRQLVNGLHHLHKNKIIHRDIKLANIGVKLSTDDEQKLKQNNDLSVFRNAQYKLLDLGLAKQLINDDLTNTYAGTELNMAPEILLRQPYSISADMYSLGVSIFQLITGEMPYKIVRGSLEIVKYETANFHLIKNETLRTIVQKMLKYYPKDRLSWPELYKYQFFNIKRGQTQSILDLQLKNNQIIYNTIENENREIEEEKFYDCENDEQIKQDKIKLLSELNNSFTSLYVCKNQMNQQQITKLKYWNKLYNIHILLNKLSSNIVILINSINYMANDLMYYSLNSEFNSYINYLCDLNQQTYNYLKLDINNNFSEYNTFQDYITLKNILESDEVQLNIQENKQNEIMLFSDLCCFARKQFKLLRSLDLKVFPFKSEEFQQQTINNNILIYNQILGIMYDSHYKICENNSQQFKLIQSQIYRILIDLARVRAMFGINWQGGDQKINELRLEDYQIEPDLLSEFLTEILQFYQLRYDQ